LPSARRFALSLRVAMTAAAAAAAAAAV